MPIRIPFLSKPQLEPASRPAGTPAFKESASEYERLAPWRARLDRLDDQGEGASAEYRASHDRATDMSPALRRQREIVEQLHASAERSSASVQKWSAHPGSATAATPQEIDSAERDQQEFARAEAELARLETKMGRIKDQQAAAGSRHQIIGSLAEACKTWLQDNKDQILQGYLPPSHPPHKEPASPQLVESLTVEIAAGKVELAGLTNVLPLQVEREQAIDAAIAHMAAQFQTGGQDAPATPWTLARARSGTRIFKGPENLPTGPLMPALCWLAPELMRERLLELADEETDPRAERLSSADQGARRADIEARLYLFERQRELAIRELEASGEEILRDRDADPCAVLCP